MRRRVYNFAAAVSLLLFLAAVSLWARGRLGWTYDGVRYSTDHPFYVDRFEGSSSPFGVTVFWRADTVPGLPYEWSLRSARSAASETDSVNDFFSSARVYDGIAGVWWFTGTRAEDRSVYEVFVPHWMLALLTGILPTAWAVGRWRRRRTIAAGCCPNCGYDLRATPEKCPECGAVRSQASGATDDQREEPVASGVEKVSRDSG